MGYRLKIGEAELEYSEVFIRTTCATASLDYAPAFGGREDHQNQALPSYSAWAHDMKALELLDVMFDEITEGGKGCFEWKGVVRYPLISHHAGAALVTREHVEVVETKLADYKILHPDHRAEYAPLKPGAEAIAEDRGSYRAEDFVDNPIYDTALCRGEWLAFWLRWAFDNCNRPVFVNN